MKKLTSVDRCIYENKHKMELCAWSEIFTDEDRSILRDGLIFTETTSALFSVCLNLSILLTNLRYDLSYRNLAFFTIITCLRRFPFSKLAYSESSPDINDSCTFNGFWNTFLSVYEVECLTHVCIERYVVAKYINNGWPLIRWHYTMYQGLCVLFALLYSVPPLFGIGSYELDFTCDSCVFDMVLPNSWHKYIVVSIYLLRSFKSAFFMIVMLYWARKLGLINKSKKMIEQAPFTKSVLIITIVNLLCWCPITMIRGLVVFYSFLGSGFIPSAWVIQWALWINSIAPAATSLSLFMIDEGIGQTVNQYNMAPREKNKI
ncbi:uncharacterized protein LOC125056046 isoform X2 [Pieris napi]|uniref:uncharacterized protein LOC125056046 isoform X2 n=1 Tax=Pieris napi TaxID=78633 RepID=UPI001FBBA3BF|nr:uncharacterized protein LOC125056046 isoform X2 [Pieris napi]